MGQDEFNLGWFELHAVDHCNLSCKGCSHFSPFFTTRYGRKEYKASEYFTAIDKLIETGVSFGRIAVLGGEPFLHSNLGLFLKEIKERYHKEILLVTNGFWIGKDLNLKNILDFVDVLSISRYREVVDKMEQFDIKINKIINEFPSCKVVESNFDKFSFTKIEFTSSYENPRERCGESSCVNLLSDGRLCRCPVAAHACDSLVVTREFMDACDNEIFYRMGSENKSIKKWREKWPMRACGYCTAWKKEQIDRSYSPEYYKDVVRKAEKDSLKIISFSLWGNNPMYSVGAIENIRLARDIYPEWICRFYTDDSVDASTLQSIEEEGAEVVRVGKRKGDNHGMFWRFYANDDPRMSVFISRDCDSRLNHRERVAVDEWLSSDRVLHVMNDYSAHHVPIMGGMWGLKRGAIPNIIEMIDRWGKYKNKGDDQDFLAAEVWPLLSRQCMRHTSIGNNHGGEFWIFPEHQEMRYGGTYVGEKFDEKNIPIMV